MTLPYSSATSGFKADWNRAIEIIKKCGAGEYGSGLFMCRKHEHWKMLWAQERIETLEAENTKLRELLKPMYSDSFIDAELVAMLISNTGGNI